MALSSIKIRLYPNRVEADLIRRNCGCCRFVWDHFLDRCQKYFGYSGKSRPQRSGQNWVEPQLVAVGVGNFGAAHPAKILC